MFRALNSKNYRNYFLGQSISMIGLWMQSLGMSWLVYRLTNSPFLLGLVLFLAQIPSSFLPLFTGTIIDESNKKTIIMITQFAAMVQAIILAILVISGHIELWHIMALSVFIGVITAFDMPARQSFMVELVDKKEDLQNAIALNAVLFHGARLIGPSIAGVIVALSNEGVCFAINAISYVAVFIALFFIQVKPKVHEHKKMLKNLVEGFNYVKTVPHIVRQLYFVLFVSLIGMAYGVLFPVVARDVLHGNSKTLGLIMASAGFGALIAGLILAARKEICGLLRFICFSAIILGAAIFLLAFSSNLYLTLVIVFFSGYGLTAFLASNNTFIQALVEDDKRGRVMSFYTMSTMGMQPFGQLLIGGLASNVGVRITLFLIGVLIFSFSIYMFKKFHLRIKYIII